MGHLHVPLACELRFQIALNITVYMCTVFLTLLLLLQLLSPTNIFPILLLNEYGN
jgi:hypothetical protein